MQAAVVTEEAENRMAKFVTHTPQNQRRRFETPLHCPLSTTSCITTWQAHVVASLRASLSLDVISEARTAEAQPFCRVR